MKRPEYAVVSVHAALRNRAAVFRDWAPRYGPAIRAQLTHAADQLGAAAHRLTDTTESLDEGLALLEATEALATLTDD